MKATTFGLNGCLGRSCKKPCIITRNRRFRGNALRVMSPAEVKSRALYTKNLFKVIFLCFMERGHFWPLEATKCKKPYSGKPKIFFFRFRPPEAKNDLFTLNTKKICSKSGFFVFSDEGSFCAPGGR